MYLRKQKLFASLLIIILLGLGIFKDEITPDYLNSPSAYFLNPNHPNYIGIWQSHIKMPMYWTLAYSYSLLHIIIPAYIIRLLYSKLEARYTLYILFCIFLIQYGILYTNVDFMVTKVLTKINRYFHSPILTFMLIAVFTLFNKNEADSRLDK
jgi:hypothetical protein